MQTQDDFEYIERAYQNLPPAEKINIDFLANGLIERMKKRRQDRGSKTPSQFGNVQARQLLAALGVWMVCNPSFTNQ